MIIINITEFKRNIREFQDEKLPKTDERLFEFDLEEEVGAYSRLSTY